MMYGEDGLGILAGDKRLSPGGAGSEKDDGNEWWSASGKRTWEPLLLARRSISNSTWRERQPVLPSSIPARDGDTSVESMGAASIVLASKLDGPGDNELSDSEHSLERELEATEAAIVTAKLEANKYQREALYDPCLHTPFFTNLKLFIFPVMVLEPSHPSPQTLPSTCPHTIFTITPTNMRSKCHAHGVTSST
jgi:hypothetical protein